MAAALAMRLYFYWKYLFYHWHLFRISKIYRKRSKCTATTTGMTQRTHSRIHSNSTVHCAMQQNKHTWSSWCMHRNGMHTERRFTEPKVPALLLWSSLHHRLLTRALSRSLLRTLRLIVCACMFGLLKGRRIRICSGRFIVFRNFYLLQTIGPLTYAQTQTKCPFRRTR